jgi:hypothetical protein
MESKNAILRRFLLLTMLLVALSGCSRHGWYVRSPLTSDPPIIVHPIQPSDIFPINAGDTISPQKGIPIVVEKPGFFVSDYYIQEIMKARIE